MSVAEDAKPVSVDEANVLFADLEISALILAISGGPDSALLVWRRAGAPRLKQVEAIGGHVDHGLRAESAREANDVKRLARKLNVAHCTLRWTGRKPSSGLQAAARQARYRLLAQAAREEGAQHVLTAHTRDDQAETMLMRLARGSGLAGLADFSLPLGQAQRPLPRSSIAWHP